MTHPEQQPVPVRCGPAGEGALAPASSPNVGRIGLTPKQRKVLDFLRAYIGQNGYSPSFEEIRHGCWMGSISRVFHYLNALEERGYIAPRGYGQRRNIQLLDPPVIIRGEPYRFIPKTHASGSVRAFRLSAGTRCQPVASACPDNAPPTGQAGVHLSRGTSSVRAACSVAAPAHEYRAGAVAGEG